MVMAQTLFKLLRRQHPNALIDVVAPAWTEPLLARMPEVRLAIPLPLGHGQLGFGARWRLGRRLRERDYTRAIVLPNSWKSAIVPFAARIPIRIGFTGEARVGLLNDRRRLDKAALPRTVDRFAALASPADVPLPVSLPPPALRAHDSEAALARLGLSAETAPILAVCPGAEYGPAKRWPATYFADVARAKAAEGWQVWLFGSQKDLDAAAEVEAAFPRCQNLVGRTSLAEALDLLALARAVVTNDSGLMHVAAALGRPVIALFGSSDPRHTPPLSERAQSLWLHLECSPCFARECPLGHLRCLRELPPQRVLEALAGLPTADMDGHGIIG